MERFLNWLHRCFSCKMRKIENRQASSENTNIINRVWTLFLTIVLFLIVILLYCWSVFQNDYNDFDWFIYDQMGSWFGWGMLILVVLALLTAFIAILALLNVISFYDGKLFWNMHLLYKICIVVIFCFCVAGYILVDMLWKEEWYTAVLALQMMAPFFQILLVIFCTLSSWLIIGIIMKSRTTMMLLISSVVYFTVILLLYIAIPLTIWSPCIKENISTIPKPKIIGHRGFPLYAPENTMLSYEAAVEYCDVHAVETDIAISMDGVPFLMHDQDLKRTTNVKDVYPDLTDQSPSLFTWEQLEKLNAGQWYLDSNPFHTRRFIPEQIHSQISSQKIPKLEDLGKFLAQHELYFIFDLYRPTYGNPHMSNYTNIVYDTLSAAGVDDGKIYWMPSYKIANMTRDHPDMVYVYQGSGHPDFIKDAGYEGINLQYNLVTPPELDNYKLFNLTIIEYVISSPWLFSWAWCQGTDVVTSNNCQGMSSIKQPAWHLTPNQYTALWVSVDLISLVLICAVYMYQFKENKRIRDELDDEELANMISDN